MTSARRFRKQYPSTTSGSRVLSIQYLRGMAALMVVAYHASNRVAQNFSENTQQIFQLGHAGVDIFFVISGFIIWTIGRNAPADPASFMLRRVIRLAPLYWMATGTWVVLLWVSGAQWISLDAGHLLRSLFFIPHWSPTFPDTFWPVLVPGWTLLFEMFFYAVFSCVLVFDPRRRFAALVSMLFVLVATGFFFEPEWMPAVAYTSPLLLEFVGGVFIAELWRHRSGNAALGVALAMSGVLLLFLFGSLVTTDQTSWSRPLVFGSSAVLIVSGLVCLEGVLPSVRVLEELGNASYAIYLFHIPLITLLREAWMRLPGTDSLAAAILFVCVALAVSSAVGLWIYHRVETGIQAYLLEMSRRPKKSSTT